MKAAVQHPYAGGSRRRTGAVQRVCQHPDRLAFRGSLESMAQRE
jgi:hypothetical protein